MTEDLEQGDCPETCKKFFVANSAVSPAAASTITMIEVRCAPVFGCLALGCRCSGVLSSSPGSFAVYLPASGRLRAAKSAHAVQAEEFLRRLEGLTKIEDQQREFAVFLPR